MIVKVHHVYHGQTRSIVGLETANGRVEVSLKVIEAQALRFRPGMTFELDLSPLGPDIEAAKPVEFRPIVSPIVPPPVQIVTTAVPFELK